MKKTIKASLLAAAALGLAAICAPAQANDWSQWRGPEQNGISRETNLPDKWSLPDKNSPGENVAWVADVGGMSSPIVMKGKVYTLSRVGEVAAGEGITATLDPGPQTQESLVCMDAKTGKVLWRHNENMYQTDDPFHRLGWSSPCGDEETGNVYALGAQNVLICCDGQTGKQIWRHQMTEEYGFLSTFGGRTPSPCINGDQVFLAGVDFGWGDLAQGHFRLFAFDKKTGRLNWINETPGIPTDAPYQTPVFTVINGEKVMVIGAGDGTVNAFQPRTGKRLWSIKVSKRGFDSSVVVQGNFVYVNWDLDNFKSTKLGGVACLDASQIEKGEPKIVWSKDGIEAGFPSPTIVDDTLYVATDNGVIYAIDAKTGKTKYRKGFGTIGKASLVWADGKLYFPEANGRMWILKPDAKKFEVLSHVDLEDKPGLEYVIFGSVAISDGHIYLNAASKFYCIGPKEFQAQTAEVPAAPREEPMPDNEKGQPPAQVQVVPFDVVMHPGQKQQFEVFGFDEKGRPLGQIKQVQWALGQLTLPAPPPRPAALMRPNSESAAKGETSAPAPKPVAPPPPPAPTGPTKVGNLQGQMDQSGTFTAAESKAFEGGAVEAQAGNVTGHARVRVIPPFPWKLDFEKSPVGKPPLTWIGAGGKFAVHDVENNKVLTKLTDIPLFARARTYFGTADEKNYTIEADIMVRETTYNDNGTIVHKTPDAGVINSRYVLELKGSKQTLGLYAWGAALPRQETDPGLATHITIPFKWKANKWYRLKLTVLQESGKAMCMGKVWAKGDSEPSDWTVKLEDDTPNTHGSPGLWGFSNDHEIYYDNVSVTAEHANAQASTK